jgi:hyperosmotically inducible protein
MRNTKRTILAATMTAALGITALTGCKNIMQKESPDGRSEGRVQDDKNITKRVEERLKEEPVYKFGTVDVKTYGGLVQLSGFVDTEDQKRRAEDIARKVPGATHVVNALVIKPGSTPTPTGQATGDPLNPRGSTNTGNTQPTNSNQ